MSLAAASLAAMMAAQAAAADGEGRRIFLEGAADMPACAVCHTLADAGSAGEIGPNLDQLKPDAARVRVAVHDGVGVMPPFGEALSAAQIEAVADYVARSAGR
jgi:mono/diheme cytochrome c family protein